MMNGQEKSDSGIVAVKPTNKAGQPAADVNGRPSFHRYGHPISPSVRVKGSVISRRQDRSVSVVLGGHAFSAMAAD